VDGAAAGRARFAHLPATNTRGLQRKILLCYSQVGEDELGSHCFREVGLLKIVDSERVGENSRVGSSAGNSRVKAETRG